MGQTAVGFVEAHSFQAASRRMQSFETPAGVVQGILPLLLILFGCGIGLCRVDSYFQEMCVTRSLVPRFAGQTNIPPPIQFGDQ
ncbi:hypothetical protein RMSM_01445 [Rhodopirellula maiorica SM1]|uniref:Uncharacterized protein n=1 Tax=Rhodopirellula maiorica SM1 TaxID=1265738 RepID=M5S608_9BACT|nr:hypothetical protein RMSM_01445 [Rhodopirellula maiorica SM1]